MITVPLSVVARLLNETTVFSWAGHLSELLLILLGLNGILFGIGLLRNGNPMLFLRKITGILEILISVLVLFPVSYIQLIVMWLAVPFLILLLSILWKGYRMAGAALVLPEE